MPKHATRRQTAHSNTYRFFVPAAAIQGSEVQIDDAELAHQMTNVLRLGAGDEVLLLDNSGWQYSVVLRELGRKGVSGSISQRELAPGEPRTQITLYLALMRPERFEWALQKATELGVRRFVPFTSAFTAIGDAGDLSERKIERWRKIIREAAEQSRRGMLPELAPVQPFERVCAEATQTGPALFLWEGNGAQSLRQALTAFQTHAGNQLSIVSGPEGGFSESERAAAEGAGLLPVTLGPRTLRAETAPIVAASAILYQLDDFE